MEKSKELTLNIYEKDKTQEISKEVLKYINQYPIYYMHLVLLEVIKETYNNGLFLVRYDTSTEVFEKLKEKHNPFIDEKL
jgi:hypothetical protein